MNTNEGIESLKKAVEELARVSQGFAKAAEDGTISGAELVQLMGALVVSVLPKYQQFADIPKELRDLDKYEVLALAQHIRDQDWWVKGQDEAEQIAEALVEWLAVTYKTAYILLKKDEGK